MSTDVGGACVYVSERGGIDDSMCQGGGVTDVPDDVQDCHVVMEVSDVVPRCYRFPSDMT